MRFFGMQNLSEVERALKNLSLEQLSSLQKFLMQLVRFQLMSSFMVVVAQNATNATNTSSPIPSSMTVVPTYNVTETPAPAVSHSPGIDSGTIVGLCVVLCFMVVCVSKLAGRRGGDGYVNSCCSEEEEKKIPILPR